jgi:hypothetical protein
MALPVPVTLKVPVNTRESAPFTDANVIEAFPDPICSCGLGPPARRRVRPPGFVSNTPTPPVGSELNSAIPALESWIVSFSALGVVVPIKTLPSLLIESPVSTGFDPPLPNSRFSVADGVAVLFPTGSACQLKD